MRLATGTRTIRSTPADGSALSLTAVAVVVALADLVTKQIAVARLSEGTGLTIGEAVRLTLFHNHGLAWGLSGGGQALAITLVGTALLLGAVAAVRRQLAVVDPSSPRMLGLIVGAAIGNALSLFVWPAGAPDFIAVATGGGAEAVINVADVALFAGLALCCRTTWRVALAVRAEREPQPTLAPTLSQRAPRAVEREIPLLVARDDERSGRIDQERRAPSIERPRPSAEGREPRAD